MADLTLDGAAFEATPNVEVDCCYQDPLWTESRASSLSAVIFLDWDDADRAESRLSEKAHMTQEPQGQV